MIEVGDTLLYVPYGSLFTVVSVDLEARTFRASTKSADVSNTLYYFSELNLDCFVKVSVELL